MIGLKIMQLANMSSHIRILASGIDAFPRGNVKGGLGGENTSLPELHGQTVTFSIAARDLYRRSTPGTY